MEHNNQTEKKKKKTTTTTTTTTTKYEDLLPVMAEKLDVENFVSELCKGFELLADSQKGLITSGSLKKNSTFLKMEGRSKEEAWNEGILLLQSPVLGESKIFGNQGFNEDLVRLLIKLPWTHSVIGSEPNNMRKTKCLSVQIASKLANSRSESDLEVLDLGLHDEDEEVRIEAVMSIPVIAMWCGPQILSHTFRRLEFIEGEKHDKVKNVIPFSLGYLSCLHGSCNTGDGLDKKGKLMNERNLERLTCSP
ncbi:hypothetical protein F8388_000983 [Cannabis sativa]|uniref:Uncharacterized protein n=1 Tax=Cannabis sativa TaxID=3483 RepID=A0A7J6FWT7_CANSA|nr:hypothetical protein F8388_000983 [Cannabis sativa]